MTEDKEAVKSFKDLGVCDQLIEACDNLGWKHPSKIQAEAIPHALDGKDLIGLAQTGSGKIGAFGIPILQALLDTPQAFFACALSPTHELAIQIAEQFEALGSGIGVKCAVLVGGVDHVQQSISIGKRPHIVVATPGRLVDHLSNTTGFSLRTLKYLFAAAVADAPTPSVFIINRLHSTSATNLDQIFIDEPPPNLKQSIDSCENSCKKSYIC